jgi:hypothetical protein
MTRDNKTRVLIDREQAARAKRKVPAPDPSRSRANPKEPWRG